MWRVTLNDDNVPVKIFIGWDSREDIAFQACKESIISNASVPVEIIPLKQKALRDAGVYSREVDTLGSTEFILSTRINRTLGLGYFR